MTYSDIVYAMLLSTWNSYNGNVLFLQSYNPFKNNLIFCFKCMSKHCSPIRVHLLAFYQLFWYIARVTSQCIWIFMGTLLYFKEDFLCVSLDNKTFKTGGLPLKERICSYKSKFFSFIVDSYWKEVKTELPELFPLQVFLFTLRYPHIAPYCTKKGQNNMQFRPFWVQ